MIAVINKELSDLQAEQATLKSQLEVRDAEILEVQEQLEIKNSDLDFQNFSISYF